MEEMGGKVVDGLLSLEFLWNFDGGETHDLFLFRSQSFSGHEKKRNNLVHSLFPVVIDVGYSTVLKL